MDLFISLGQPDGRLVPGEQYPFPDNIHHVMFSVFKLNKDETVMTKFDRKRKPKMSTIKEYRELSEYFSLKKGRYVIVPRYFPI